MKRLLFLVLCSLPAFGAACTMQIINGSDPISTGPTKLNANFNCLNTNKITKFSGAIVPASVTGSKFGDFYQNTSTNLTYQCFAIGPCTAVAPGNWVLLGSGSGGSIASTTSALRGDGAGGAIAVTGTGTNCVLVNGSSGACGSGSGDVVGPGSATDNAITRYDGTTGKLIQNSLATVDDSGNLTANSFTSTDTSHSGGLYYQGLTSGGLMVAVNDVAGTAVTWLFPTDTIASGTGKFLKDQGSATCPTLATGSPAVCHQIIWAAGGGGGTGCVPSGVSGQILTDDGAGGCNSSTPTISGSTITASLTGHASLDVPTTTTLTGGAGIAAIGDLSTNRTIATASGEADFLASGALTCGAATQGKMQVHTTPLQYCDNAATPTLRYAAYGDSSGNASAVAVGSITGLGTGVGTALATNVSGTGAICLASGSACSGGGSGGLTLVEQHTASSSASLDFTTCISSTYDTYEIKLVNVLNATNAQDLLFRVSTNGGSSYDSGSNYAWGTLRLSTVPDQVSAGASGTTSINLTGSGNTLNSVAAVNGSLTLYAPGSGSLFTQLNGLLNAPFNTSFGASLIPIIGVYQSSTAVNAFQFFSESGNIASGTIRCYGVAK